MVGFNLEIRRDLASAVGRVLRGRGVGDRNRTASAKHRKEDGSEDLVEREHDSSGVVSVSGCGGARAYGGWTETGESLSERRRERNRLENVGKMVCIFYT